MPDGMSPVQVKRRTKPAVRSIASIVDELGLLKAQIAPLSAREKELKEQLVACGLADCVGTLYDANVSRSTRVSLDSKKIRKVHGKEWCALFEKSAEVVTVTVTARKQSSKSRAA